MKTGIYYLIFVMGFAATTAMATPKERETGKSYFEWQGQTRPVSMANQFEKNAGNYRITGSDKFQNRAKELLNFFSQMDRKLLENFGLTPGVVRISIPLMDQNQLEGKKVHSFQVSNEKGHLIFPLVVDPEASWQETQKSVSFFQLVRAVIMANFAYGDEKRLPVSSHAYRFIDGLSGYLALATMENRSEEERKSLLQNLDRIDRLEKIKRQYSATQLMRQNASSESISLFSGLDQFLSGVILSENREDAVALPDNSTTGNRIKVFQTVAANSGTGKIRQLIEFMNQDAMDWEIRKGSEDGFCLQYVGIGCKESSLDGTRADLILKRTTNMSFAEILQAVRQEKPEPIDQEPEALPSYSNYGFDFPKAGGANEAVVELALIHSANQVKTEGVIEDKSVPNNGFRLAFGMKDEIYEGKVMIQYLAGEQEDSNQTIRQKEFLVGTTITERGKMTGWGYELGVYYHWINTQAEWNIKGNPSNLTDRKSEYINRGYHFLDVHNYRSIMFNDWLEAGLNLDLRIGAVSHSGSTKYAKDEKFNTDAASLLLGANVGPEVRFRLPMLNFELKTGASLDYLWQPFDDEGGGENSKTINATQSMTRTYLSLGINF